MPPRTEALTARGLSTSGKKAELLKRLLAALAAAADAASAAAPTGAGTAGAAEAEGDVEVDICGGDDADNDDMLPPEDVHLDVNTAVDVWLTHQRFQAALHSSAYDDFVYEERRQYAAGGAPDPAPAARVPPRPSHLHLPHQPCLPRSA